MSKEILYGPTYAPLSFPEEGWEKDLQLMADAHMNLMRVGDIGTWDQIEAVEGQFDFAQLERFFVAAEKYGLKILLSTGTASPPLWLAYKYPDVRIVSSRGEAYPLGASYHWADIHHPGYLEACANYIRELGQMAARQPNLFGWQISNEIGFPFNPTREEGDIDLYCYSEHSKAAFRDWLRKKYESLEALAEAWSWSTTNFRYANWDEAFPPEALPKAWSSVTRWLDWRLFWQDAFTQHAAWEHEQIRKVEADKPTSVNIFNFKGYDRFGTYTGLDQWKMAEVVDNIGYDLYPGSGDKLATRPEHTSMFLDHGRSVSYFAGSDFWLHEIESGPIGGWLLGPEHNTSPEDILNMCFESLGHDAKLLIYMPWREWLYQPLHWGALLDLQGQPTPRLEAAAKVGSYIKENEAFLNEARVPKGEIALLESKANAIFLRGVGNEEELFVAQRGAYRAFWEQGYRVDFITPKQLLEGHADDYKMICLPLMGLIPTETAQALQSYAAQGGVVLGFARAGTLDERGWYHAELPIEGLKQLFGIEMIEADTLDGQAIQFGGQSYPAWMNRDLVTASKQTETIAEFEDGNPAITVSPIGKGLGAYLATQADAGYLKTEGNLLGKVIQELAKRKGIAPLLSLDYEGKEWRELDAHLLDTPGRSEIILTNYLSKASKVELKMNESQRAAKAVQLGILNKTTAAFKQAKGELVLSLELGAEEVQIVTIQWGLD